MRLTIVLLWIALAYPAFSQPGFNSTYHFGYPRDHFRNLIVHQDTVVAYGMARTDTFPYRQCLFVARFDSSGVPIDQALICDALGGLLSMDINWAEIITTSDGGFALTAASFNRYDGMFIKLKNNLSVEFAQEYEDSVNLVEFYNSIVELPDGYLLGGYVQSPNYLAESFLRRVDKHGNSLWFKYYGKYVETDLFSYYYQLNDTTVAYVGGYVNNPNSLAGRGPWIVLINPENGKIIKEWRPGSSAAGTVHFLFPLTDTTWLIYGKKTLQVSPVQHVRPYWAIIDTAFNLIDMQLFGPGPLISNFIWDIEPTPDGNFIAAGELYAANPNTEPADIYGWLYKVSPELDGNWSLQLIAPVPEPKVSGNYLGGVGVLSSGNMVAGGYSSYNGEITCWLVKFSTDGCVDTLWCAVTPDWEPDGPEIQPRQLRLYPNPAQEAVFVELPEGDYPVWVELYTLDGRLCHQQAIDLSDSIDVSDLLSGYYICRIIGRKGHRYLSRVVICHS
ncbi:MAG: T9SS type A sorting domain-containing protein [Saprospirales bacterium]|nr:T9SS type A sorting domain-containing protein [Saprospirales bacterium]